MSSKANNMGDHFTFDLSTFTLPVLRDVINRQQQIELGEEAKKQVKTGHSFLHERMSQEGQVIYGVNTGFGSLRNTVIHSEKLSDLQHNLIRSHACGTGDKVPMLICKLILLSKIRNLSFGYSGVRPLLIEKLIELYNKDIIPVIYQLGSLGASGDLAPLAHLSLPLLGEGQVYHDGVQKDMASLVDDGIFSPIVLEAKEGLSLLNGTQFSLAYSIYNSLHAERIFRLANLIASLSLEAYACRIDPFHPTLSAIRNHSGQQHVAQTIKKLLSDSQIINQPSTDVQDPYSFRCIPQVHGATRSALDHIKNIVEGELNAVTDNPNILFEEKTIISGGNFHAQVLALPLDYLCIAIAELGSISERRVFKLVNGDRDLPAYLSPDPGLESGFMIAQYTAASIVSQNKQLCTPASVDSITSSKGQEDHVSMAANAATKCYKVIENLYRLLSIELMCAAQGVELRSPLRPSSETGILLNKYREVVPSLKKDRVLSIDIQNGVNFLKNY